MATCASHGWIFDDNLPAFCALVAAAFKYPWDDGDQTAVDHGLTTTDADADLWFDYPIVPIAADGPVATLEVAADHDGGVILLHLDLAAPTQRLIGRIEGAIEACSEYSVRPWGERI